MGRKNTVGKAEIARYEQFLLFLQCFQKTHCRQVKKTGACLGKGYKNLFVREKQYPEWTASTKAHIAPSVQLIYTS